MSLSRQRESGFKKTRWSATQGLGRLRPHPSLPATSDGVGRWWCAAWPRSFWCHSEVCSERSQPMSRSHLEVAAVGRRRRKEKTEFLTKGRPVSRPAASRRAVHCTAACFCRAPFCKIKFQPARALHAPGNSLSWFTGASATEFTGLCWGGWGGVRNRATRRASPAVWFA